MKSHTISLNLILRLRDTKSTMLRTYLRVSLVNFYETFFMARKDLLFFVFTMNFDSSGTFAFEVYS